ncbi:MAG TPA: acyl-CoA dehydratase activase [Thermoanaerobaculia bacterium]|nr:acyl-CoA dehydratase activase [Thermoanaerobaculia bacterium]
MSLYTAAVDLGSGFTKAVVIAADEESHSCVIGRGRVKTGIDLEGAAGRALAAAVADAGLGAGDVSYTATTGFGRYGFSARDIQITDITSAACGAHHLHPEAPVVLDIGNQATRAIAVTPEGRVKTFKTNDKCAAGSGSFIGRAAKYLEVPLEEVGAIALKANNPQPISSVCAVLAESEIINLVSAGVSIEDILRGIYDSLAERAGTLLRRVGLGSEITFIGGVARQQGMVKAIESRLGVKVHVPDDADYVCAIGAALLGQRRAAAQRGGTVNEPRVSATGSPAMR